MAFCSFSKDCEGNSHVIVDNKFITKYLPIADGLAVKVYLYGLYLCENAQSEFSLASLAEVLDVEEDKIIDAFTFWQDYDLIDIVSKDPFAVQYLPVKAVVGRPKKVRYEQYGDFNKELQRKLQRAGKFVSASDYLKYMRFLEDNAMQPQALLLIAEYCVNKQGEAVSHSYIFNKAKKFLRDGLTTYELVERELSSFNASEGDVKEIFTALGLNYGKAPVEADFSLYRKWTSTLQFTKEAIVAAAKRMKRGNMNSLDVLLEDLYEREKRTTSLVVDYLDGREFLANLTFRIARKLGVKVSNPATYIDEYVERWVRYGFEDVALLDVALFCLKTERNSFDDMNTTIETLRADNCIEKDRVKAFIKQKNEELKLFSKIQDICGTIRKNSTNLALIQTWKSWNFNDDMILAAAKRSTTSASPLPYMNKILTEWKSENIFDLKNVSDLSMSSTNAQKVGFVNAQVAAVNERSDRERYYALLREKALKRAEKYQAKANANEEYKKVAAALSKMEISLAKAEVFESEKLPTLRQEKQALLLQQKNILAKLGIAEKDLQPIFACVKCSDTGFLPNGSACDCYKK